ncbi:phosphotransferase, partial [Escherichia coli]|uniref:phosphotransferase n=1 Tax=Escherichia coli TaxID=562 RepID=UPI000ACDC715
HRERQAILEHCQHPRLWFDLRAYLGSARDAQHPPTSIVDGGDHDPIVEPKLIDNTERVSGMIDWSEARVDDPAIDMAAHLMVFGEEGLAKLLLTYEAAGGRVWPRLAHHIAERLAFGAVTYALFALDSARDAQHPPTSIVDGGDHDPIVEPKLIDNTERVSGMIDWSEARVDDPAIDMAAHLMVFGEEGLAKLLLTYEAA